MAPGPFTGAAVSGGIFVVALQTLRGLVWPAKSFSARSYPQAPIASGDAVGFSGPSFFSNADLGERHVCECRRQASDISVYEEGFDEDPQTDMSNMTSIYDNVDPRVWSWGLGLFVGVETLISFTGLVWLTAQRRHARAKHREEELRKEKPELQRLHEDMRQITEALPQFAVLSRQFGEIFNHFGVAEEPGSALDMEISKLRPEMKDCEQEVADLTKKLVAASLAKGKAKDKAVEAERQAEADLLATGRKLANIRCQCIDHLKKALESLHRCAQDVSRELASSEPRSIRSPNIRGENVRKRVQNWSTEEGRQKHREETEHQDGGPEVVDAPTPLREPPCKQLGADEWQIEKVYTHQVLKIGLRWLDANWDTKDLLDLPVPRSGSSGLLKPKLILDLLSGEVHLKSVPSNDVSAAQGDIEHLSLRQLLRLRVRHLDFTPSGCGSNSVHGAQSTHEALLTKIDTKLFRQLGETPIQRCAPSNLSGDLRSADYCRLGREVVLLVAAAIVIKEPAWWCWWLSDADKVFFCPKTFKSRCEDGGTDYCMNSFPEGGVLSLTDHTKHCAQQKDLQWFDWHVQRINSEDALPKVRPAGNTASASEGTGATGAAVAEALSPELLKQTLGSLRRTGSTPGTPHKGSGTVVEAQPAQAG